MIYIGIIDTANIDPSEDRVISKIPGEARGRVEKTKSERERAARVGAYIMLSGLCRRIFDAKNIQICYTDKGKPYIRLRDNANNSSQTIYNVSLSHDGDISAVVITDGNFDVGIDVQSPRGNVNIEAVSKRFFEKCEALAGDLPEERSLIGSPNFFGNGISLICFNFKNGQTIEAPYSEFLSESGNISENERLFLRKWTFLESALKMSGKGFGALKSFDKIIEGSDCRRLDFFKRGMYYSLTVCVKEKNEPDGNCT